MEVTGPLVPAVPRKRAQRAPRAPRKAPRRRASSAPRHFEAMFEEERRHYRQVRGLPESGRMPPEVKRERAKRKAAETKALKEQGLYQPRKKGKTAPYKRLGKSGVVAIERNAARRVEGVLAREQEMNKRWASLQQAWTRYSLAFSRGDYAAAQKWNAVYAQRGEAYNRLLEERAALLKSGKVPQRQRAPRLVAPPKGKRPKDGTKAAERWDARLAEYQEAAARVGAPAPMVAAPTPSPLSSAAAAAVPPTPSGYAGSPMPMADDSVVAARDALQDRIVEMEEEGVNPNDAHFRALVAEMRQLTQQINSARGSSSQQAPLLARASDVQSQLSESPGSFLALRNTTKTQKPEKKRAFLGFG